MVEVISLDTSDAPEVVEMYVLWNFIRWQILTNSLSSEAHKSIDLTNSYVGDSNLLRSSSPAPKRHKSNNVLDRILDLSNVSSEQIGGPSDIQIPVSSPEKLPPSSPMHHLAAESTPQRGRQNTLFVVSSQDDSFYIPQASPGNRKRPMASNDTGATSASPSTLPRANGNKIGYSKPQKSPVRLINIPAVNFSAETSNPAGAAAEKENGASMQTVVPKHVAMATNRKYRQQVASLNKAKYTKEELMAQMILSIQYRVCDSLPSGELLMTVEKQYTTDPIIQWKRKVSSKYDEQECLFLPDEESVQEENVCAYFYDSSDFFTKVCRNHEFNFPKHKQVFVLLDGYDSMLTKLSARENRAHQYAVLQRISASQSETSPSKSKSRRTADIDGITLTKDQIQEKMIELELSLDICFHTTKGSADLATWLNKFTHAIAQSRYIRDHKFGHFSTGMKSGSDSKDTYMKALQQVRSLTLPKVTRVAAVYDTMPKLYEAFKKGLLNRGLDGKPLFGPQIEKTLATLLKSKNPNDILLGE